MSLHTPEECGRRVLELMCAARINAERRISYGTMLNRWLRSGGENAEMLQGLEYLESLAYVQVGKDKFIQLTAAGFAAIATTSHEESRS